jgi:uncharacterized membrane protein
LMMTMPDLGGSKGGSGNGLACCGDDTIVKAFGFWVRFRKNVSRRMASGMLVLVPVGVTLLVMRWLFAWGTALLRPVVKYAEARLQGLHWIESLPDAFVNFYVYLLTILLLLLLLYLIGVLGQYLVGRRLIGAWEGLWLRIPLARTIYGATKQVVEALSMPQGAAFKSVVVVDFPYPGLKAIGFLTGYVADGAGRRFAKVLIPTTPNPTTGFLELVPVEAVFITDLAIEEGFKMIISGGIVSPEYLLKHRQDRRAES